jgi:hypothetical protein
MVIVDPDLVTILDFCCHGLCKEAVDLLVCFPRGLVKGDFSGMVVEEGPEDGV